MNETEWTVEDATAMVARAEQRYERADAAADAAVDEAHQAKLELTRARAALRKATRARIEAAKG